MREREWQHLAIKWREHAVAQANARIVSGGVAVACVVVVVYVGGVRRMVDSVKACVVVVLLVVRVN